jgi:high-affinity iron transporter
MSLRRKSRKHARRASVLLGLAFLAPCIALGGKPDVDAGKKLFVTNCAVCHGEHGDGKGPAAASLTPPPRDFTAGTWLKGTSADDLFQMMSKGVPGSAMPTFEALPEKDRRAIAAFIKTLKK